LTKYVINTIDGMSFEFNGKYRRDLEVKNWHYYERDDGIILHFRKEHIVSVIGDTANEILNSQSYNDLNEIEKAKQLCEIYFNIASDIIGEDQVRKLRCIKIKEINND
jgi:hypothetical protein